MLKSHLLSATALRTFAACGLAIAASVPAYAEDAATTDQAAAVATEAEAVEVAQPEDAAPARSQDTIVVTGSRIRRPNLESTVPITSLSGDSLFQQADTNIGETLNELPQLRSTVAQQNPGLGIGIGGLNLLDLRGLGTVRTLVLVNGRRHVAADILNNAVSPDVNTIPNDLVERVDIVTGGNSAIYGSDAMAGVVNFVLKRSFQGIQVRGQAAASPRGFGGNQYISAMYGTNFADDRGNIILHGEYANQDRIFGSDLPWLRSVDGLVTTDIDQGGLPNGSDGIPDATFLRDVRSATIHRFGLIPINQKSNIAAPPCGFGISNGAPGNGNAPLAYNCNFIFDKEGNLSPQTGTRFGQGITGSFVGGNGQTGREGQLLSLFPATERYNFNAIGHFTIKDALEPFFEAKWNRVNAVGNNAGPTFIQGTRVAFDARERVRLDNPFLGAAQRTQIASAILASGCNTDLSVACATKSNPNAGLLSATDIANINNGSYRFVIARTLLDAGIRDEEFRRDTYRFVGGLRGSFNDDWNYEISVNYGKFKEHDTNRGFLDKQRFLLSLDAGLNPATGAIECRAKFDPTAKIAFPNSPENLARLDADVAACVPYNPFGGKDNGAAIAYFSYDAKKHASLSQLVVSGFVAGDSSQLFELPGGPISFAIGAEYRKEKARYIDDPFVQPGNTNNVIIGDFTPDPFTVKEAFGEVQIPILKNTPFFEELTVSGAARIADYGGGVGKVWAFNAGGEWAPVKDLRFRANFSRAVRAPNLSETGFPPVPNFAPGFTDPCSSGAIANNPNRTANCHADLSDALLATIRTGSYSLPIISGSNPDLTAEKSDSLTIGAVIQPRWIPGLSLSVDWYKIKVKDVIVSLTAQTIVNSCYDQPNLNNIFCTLFERYRDTTPGPLGTNPGEVLANSLISAGINFAARKREGIDFNLAYRGDIGKFAKVNTNLIYTRNLQISNFENPAIPSFENQILLELGDPKNEFRWDIDLSRGPFTFGYRMHFIGRMFTNNFENFNELESACTPAGCPPLNLDSNEPRLYPQVFYHDIRAELNLKDIGGFGKGFNIFAGVDNVLDTHPPLGLSGTGTTGITDRGTGNAAIYDARGRFLYAGFKANF